jgi:P27 family predicted phage terminase small subunit
MPRNGRRPAPTSIKHLHGVRSSRINAEEPMPHEIEPEPPEWAEGEWLAIWQRTCDQLRGMGILYAADREALVCLVTSVYEYDRLARTLVKAPPIIRDANGQPVANPVGRALRQCSAEVSRWCSHFGLTPAERGRISRLGTAPGKVEETDDLAGVHYR